MDTPALRTARASVPAEARYSHVLGLVASGLAAGLDLDSDRIDDIDLALDEVTEALAALEGATRISLIVTEGPSVMTCRLTATGPGMIENIAWDDLRSRVLETITDRIEIATDPPAVALSFHRSS